MGIYTAALATRVEATLAALAARQTQLYAVLRPGADVPTYTAEAGSKYVRVIENFADGRRRAFAFFNEAGDILKATSWYAPAKGARGNINTETNGVEFFGVDGPMTAVAAATFYKEPDAPAVEAAGEATEAAEATEGDETNAVLDGANPLAEGDENVLLNENVATV